MKNFRPQYSEEEYIEFEKVTLEMLNNNILSITRIAKRLGTSRDTVYKAIERLEAKGDITEEQIEEKRKAQERAREEQATARKMQKAKVAQEKEADRLKEVADREEVYRSIVLKAKTEDGLTQEEILALPEISFGERKLSQIVRQLKAEGLITDQKVKQARLNRKAKEEKGTVQSETDSPKYTEELKSNVLTYLNAGRTTRKISNKFQISISDVKAITNILIFVEKRTTEDIIKQALEARKNIRYTVLEYLEQGYEYGEIADMIPCSDFDEVNESVKKLKKEEKYNSEKIEKARFERREKAKFNAVWDGLRAGLSYGEIEERNKSLGLKKDAIIIRKNKIVDMGLMSDEDIKKAVVERRNRESGNEVEEEEEDEPIRKLVKLGFSINQISRILTLSESYIVKRRKVLKMEGDFTKDRELNAAARRKAIFKMTEPEYEQEMDLEVIKDQITYVTATLKLDEISPKDILPLAEIIPMLPEFITLSNVNLVVTGFSKGKESVEAVDFLDRCILRLGDDEVKLEKLRKAREEIISNMTRREKRKMETASAKQEKLKYEIRESVAQIQEQQLIELDNNKVGRRKAIRRMLNAENLTDTDLDIASEHMFFARIQAERGKVEKEDLNLLADITELAPSLVTAANLDFIAVELAEKGEVERAVDFLNDSMLIIEDDEEKYSKMLSTKASIHKKVMELLAAQMLQNNCSISQIMNRTYLREVEVISVRNRVNGVKLKKPGEGKTISSLKPEQVDTAR